jgi:alginate O-acetyltransferase complex protein AlgI
MLLVASYVFYGLWNPPLILLLWISTAIDYVAGKRLSVEEDKKKRKLWLLLSMVVNLGFLGYFKYGGFLMENFTLGMNALGFNYEAPAFDIILPMGISFYTFQTMSYTIDLYKRKIQPSRTFLDFALYVTFFPQLVAGPIVRSDELIPQFYSPKRADGQTFLLGLLLLTIGLFEKTVLADSFLSPVADQVFNHPEGLLFVDAWMGVLAFSGQIFFDFAGYSLCAIGIAKMLGMHLPDNFRYPYGAIGFSDLWQRWHISLSSWLRDYLYIPLGGNRIGVHRTNINLMVTMLLGGLWHGAAWTFVFWGFLHGLYLGVERFFKGKFGESKSLLSKLLLAFLTFTAVNITWVFFRSQTFGEAWELLKSMMLFGGKPVLQYAELWLVGIISTGLFIGHFAMRNTSLVSLLKNLPSWLLVLLWGVMIFGLMIVQSSGQQFIYFQF